ncbi:transposase DDE domain protein [Staphylococcus aureus]|nr:transposase DDE domain protein [Staphylococcus aureus]
MSSDTNSLAHTKWNCKYHIVFAPKYRRQVIYGKIKKDIGIILRQLCERKGVEIIEAEACKDHIHMLVSIPPKLGVSSFVGYLKGKSSLMIFDRHANLNDRYGFKRDFKLYECDDCSACSLRQQCMKPNSKSNKKIMKNYNWEYFKAQINQKLSEPETKKIYSQRKIDVEPVFGFMKAILGFTRMSVRGINKVKRELGFVLMALNIRKIVARRAVYYQIHLKKADFYQIINRNQLFYIA